MGVANDSNQQAAGGAWGEDISDERKAELEAVLQTWEKETDHGDRKGPFDNGPDEDAVTLTGADVFWLAARALAGTNVAQAIAEQRETLCNLQRWRGRRPLSLSALHLERAKLTGAHLEQAYLLEVHLEGADLVAAHLVGAQLGEAILRGADLTFAHLEGAKFGFAHLEGARLNGAHLEGARLDFAHLEQANLGGAYLQGASLVWAHLEGASLFQARLSGEMMPTEDLARVRSWIPDFQAVLPGADLRLCFMDQTTLLEEAIFGHRQQGSVQIADVRWGQANVAVVDWSRVTVLGDERVARVGTPKQQPSTATEQAMTPTYSRQDRWQFRQLDRAGRLHAFQEAARANRQLATVLREQGISDEADRYAYRAQLMQRHVLRRQHKYGAWLFAWLLAVLAGYGFRLERIFITYVLAVSGFALVYLTVGIPGGFPHGTVPLLDAFQVSVTAIHGRVFFEQLKLGSIVAWIAAAESIVGILIEGVFTAMLVQRFFGSK